MTFGARILNFILPIVPYPAKKVKQKAPLNGAELLIYQIV